MTRILASAAVIAAFLGACADGMSSEPGANAGVGGTAGTTGDAGAFEPVSQQCQSDDDCPGQRCLRFGVDGPSACLYGPSGPWPEPFSSECASDDDCEAGRCVGVPTQDPLCDDGGSSGTGFINQCLMDECSSDADCPLGACTPEGQGDVRSCIPASCHRDADCNAEPAGACVYLERSCCYGNGIFSGARAAQLVCVYPSDGCQTDADCGSTYEVPVYCAPQDGRMSCSDGC